MNKTDLIIKKYNPCQDAVDYLKTQDSFESAWENCPRGDWMLWIAKRLKVNIRIMALTKGYCAKTVIHLMKDKRSVNAVKTAIRFGRYKATRKELDDAAAYAYDAADAAYDAYADAYAYAYAYDAYADAAYADAYAYAYAYAADADADAYADADADADAYDAADAARKENRLKTADICRKYLTKSVMSKINNLNK